MFIVGNNDAWVNSIQKFSNVIIQKSTKEGFAERIVYLLKKPDVVKAMGVKAREIVREKFLITRLLSDYLYMLNSILN